MTSTPRCACAQCKREDRHGVYPRSPAEALIAFELDDQEPEAVSATLQALRLIAPAHVVDRLLRRHHYRINGRKILLEALRG